MTLWKPETVKRGQQFYYRVFDAVLASEIEMPELEMCVPSTADFVLSLAQARTQDEEFPWFHHWYADDEKTWRESSVAREGESYQLRFWAQADFRISQNGCAITCEPFSDTPLETIRHLFLDHVLPRIFGQRGEVVLHASAVELVPGVGIAFIGKSGWGKSTLASSFREVGAVFLGDDCLKLTVVDGELIGIPAYGGSRLWADSVEALFPGGVNTTPVSHYNDKRRVDFRDRADTNPTVFKALFFLQSPEDARNDQPLIRPMGGSAAIIELIKRSFLLDVKNVDSAKGQFASIGVLLKTQPSFYTLQYPREYARLPEVHAAIADTVGLFLHGADRRRA